MSLIQDLVQLGEAKKVAKKEAKKKLIPAVKSLGELRMKAKEDKRYEQLAIIAAQNLGGDSKSLEAAMQCLNNNAMETDEKGVVDEVNFCRDLIKEDDGKDAVALEAVDEKDPKRHYNSGQNGSDDFWGPHADDKVKIKKVFDMIMSNKFAKWYEKDFMDHVEGEEDAKDESRLITDLHGMLT